jgi:hypothetical protein
MRGEPNIGAMEFDVVTATGRINGKPSALTMAAILHEWALKELERKQFSRSWLVTANVSINYSRIRKDGEIADLSATARIRTSYGDFSATCNNAQPLFHMPLSRAEHIE